MSMIIYILQNKCTIFLKNKTATKPLAGVSLHECPGGARRFCCVAPSGANKTILLLFSGFAMVRFPVCCQTNRVPRRGTFPGRGASRNTPPGETGQVCLMQLCTGGLRVEQCCKGAKMPASEHVAKLFNIN